MAEHRDGLQGPRSPGWLSWLWTLGKHRVGSGLLLCLTGIQASVGILVGWGARTGSAVTGWESQQAGGRPREGAVWLGLGTGCWTLHRTACSRPR